MKLQRYEIVLRRYAHPLLPLETVASCAGVHPALIERFIECDLIEPIVEESLQERMFEASVIPRVKRIERLRGDLGINVAGVAVILDMLDRIETLQRENSLLRLITEQMKTGE